MPRLLRLAHFFNLARASATCFSRVETAKAKKLDPYDYLVKVLQNITTADTLEQIKALLPWNVK